MKKDVVVQTDKYKFIFYNYDSDNVVTTTLTISTKKVTAARAKEMLLECKTKYFRKYEKYIYQVLRNGQEINPRSLK